MTDAAVLADRFDGFSIAARKLRQLALGGNLNVNGRISGSKEGNTPVSKVLDHLIQTAHASGCSVTVRGRTLSRSHNLVGLLVEAGIDAISLSPQGIPSVKKLVAEAETKRGF